MTLFERLAAARERLVDAGIAPREAAVDVDVYARTILKWDRAQVLLNHQAPVPPGLEPTFSEWIARREQFEPTAYIVGGREFWGLDLLVTPAVLVPRPETELIVEEAIARAQAARPDQPFRFADIGTGSGNIAVAVAHSVPTVIGVATDVSREALDVARENARRHGVEGRLEFVCTSYLDNVDGPFDLITANPPYVRDIDKRGLSRDVLQEPHVALFGGDNGLQHLDAVLVAATRKLKAGRSLIMEFGFGQEDDVRALTDKYPELHLSGTRADLQGLARTAIIQRR